MHFSPNRHIGIHFLFFVIIGMHIQKLQTTKDNTVVLKNNKYANDEDLYLKTWAKTYDILDYV